MGGASTEGPGAVEVRGPLTVETVAGVKTAILAARDQSNSNQTNLSVNLTGVTQFDLAGLQLLYSLLTTGGQSTNVTWGEVGERMNRMSRFAGLKPIMETRSGAER